MQNTSTLKAMLLAAGTAGALGLALAVTPVSAADDGDDYADQRAAQVTDQNGEEIEVIAPRLRVERGVGINPPEKLTTSAAVYYGDLDLRTRAGEHTLRVRVREATGSICDELDSMYPESQSAIEYDKCYRQAVTDAMHRVNRTIRNARYASND